MSKLQECRTCRIPLFPQEIGGRWRKKSLDTGGLKQLVQNYAQENTDLVTCLKGSTLDPVLQNSFLGAWSEVNGLLITFRDLGPLCGSTSSIYTWYGKDRMENGVGFVSSSDNEPVVENFQHIPRISGGFDCCVSRGIVTL